MREKSGKRGGMEEWLIRTPTGPCSGTLPVSLSLTVLSRWRSLSAAKFLGFWHSFQLPSGGGFHSDFSLFASLFVRRCVSGVHTQRTQHTLAHTRRSLFAVPCTHFYPAARRWPSSVPGRPAVVSYERPFDNHAKPTVCRGLRQVCACVPYPPDLCALLRRECASVAPPVHSTVVVLCACLSDVHLFTNRTTSAYLSIASVPRSNR